VKSAGQPYAGNPHVRLEEGAPVGTPCEDTQAPPTERGGNSYGLAKAQPDRALLYIRLNGSLAQPKQRVNSDRLDWHSSPLLCENTWHFRQSQAYQLGTWGFRFSNDSRKGRTTWPRRLEARSDSSSG